LSTAPSQTYNEESAELLEKPKASRAVLNFACHARGLYEVYKQGYDLHFENV